MFNHLQISFFLSFFLSISPLSLALEDHAVLKNLFVSPEEHPKFKKQTSGDPVQVSSCTFITI